MGKKLANRLAAHRQRPSKKGDAKKKRYVNSDFFFNQNFSHLPCDCADLNYSEELQLYPTATGFPSAETRVNL